MTLSKPDSFRDHLQISYDHISKNSIQDQEVQFPEINSLVPATCTGATVAGF